MLEIFSKKLAGSPGMQTPVAQLVRDMDPGDLEDIVELMRNPRFQVLIRIVQEARSSYFTNLAQELAKRKVPEESIDLKRAYWEGALWAIEKLPNQTETQWKRFLKQSEEAE